MTQADPARMTATGRERYPRRIPTQTPQPTATLQRQKSNANNMWHVSAAEVADSFTDFDTFYRSVADVQWMDGEPPDAATQQRILVDAWNFLALDEAQLEEDDLNRRIDEGLED